MTWPAVAVWILIVLAALPRSPLPLLYLYSGLGAFMTLTLAPTGGGGLNLLGQSVCAGFLVCKLLLTENRLPRAWDAAVDPNKLGLLFIFLAYALFSAYVMPRFFAQLVEVIPMSVTVDWAIPLQPTPSNLAQSAYMAMSVGMALAMFVMASSASFRQHYMKAAFFGGLVLIATGIADAVLSAAGLSDLLEPFRNASYALLTNVEIADGAKRIVGLMPEASAYGAACVVAASTLIFFRPCFEDERWRNLFVPLGIAGLLAMAVLSTSSTAYVGLGVLALTFGVNWLRRALSANAPARGGLQSEAFIAIAGFLLLLAIIALFPDLMQPVYNRLDTLIFKKTESDSYLGRTMWTQVAMQAFFATNGLGVGLGGARTSNWFASILSNTGIFGTILLFGFILRLYFRRYNGVNPLTAEFVTALKFSLIPQFAMLALSGTNPDIGTGMASALGLIAALTLAPEPAAFRAGPSLRRPARARSRR